MCTNFIDESNIARRLYELSNENRQTSQEHYADEKGCS
jgi:hypothetical protein